jgi:N-acyl-phosphatidylethanolamine-hydrolysing phospholipase D
MDEPTLTALHKQHNPHFFAPLNNDAMFESLGIAPTHFHTLDWWEASEVAVELPKAGESATGTVTANFRLTCTPSQHQSARGMFDRMHTLWSSWALEELPSTPSPSPHKLYKLWFGGDTGYRHVSPHENEDDVPVCPAFKEIGDKFGGFDLALIPIGAYNPRDQMSSVHASPSDAVRIFQDIRAKKGVGMHWGTWVLTVEPVMEPPTLLAQEVKKAGLKEDAFTVCGLGETVVAPQ